MSTSEPLYKSIAATLKKQIEDSFYERGDRLPTEAKLGLKFRVSRVTIRQAISLLVDDGYVKKIQGSGTHVIYSRHNKILDRSSKIIPFSTEMRLIGKEPSAEVKNFELIRANKQLALDLELEADAAVFFYDRILYGNQYPYCYEKGFMPLKHFPDFSLTHIANSKIDYIEKEKNLIIEYSHQIVHAIAADEQLAADLKVSLKAPLLEVTHITYDDEDLPIMKTCVIFDSTVYQAHFIKYKGE